MRDLKILLNRMLEVIPESENELINALKNNRDSVQYAAPETIPMWFNTVQENLIAYIFVNWYDFETVESLTEYLKENNLLWQEELRKIWVGEE